MSNMSGKEKKRKGPIRIEAIVPIIIVIALLSIYFRWFFDANLRSVLQYAATQVHGAEVNISSVSTSFLSPSIVIRNIQITDKDMPKRNLFSLGKIELSLLGDALLRAKLVVNKAAIEQIEIYKPRKSKGFILPPPKPSDKPSTAREIEAAALNTTANQYNKNVLGDIAEVLKGVDTSDQLKNIQATLKSEKRIEELEKFAKEKENVWKKRIEELPKPKELEDLVEKAKGLKFSSDDPIKSLKNLRELEKIIKQADDKIDAYKDSHKGLKKDYKNLEAGLKNLDQYIKQDIDALRKRFNIPDIDSKSLSKNIFMNYLDSKIAGIRKYAAVAKDYMPKKKSKTEMPKPVVPRKRGDGINVKYPITVAYPLFWLKEAKISSKAYKENPNSGDISGSLTNVSTAPTYIKKPAVLDIKGSFPFKNINGVQVKLLADHTGEVAKQTFDIKVASMPVGKIKLSDSSDLAVAITESTGVLNFNGKLEESRLDIVFENYLRNAQFEVEAKENLVKEIIGGAFEAIPMVSVYGRFSGTWNNINLRVSSNLGDQIAKGVKARVQEKVEAAKKQIEEHIEQKIAGKKKAVEQKVKAIQDELEGQLKKEQDKVESKVQEAKNELKRGKDSQKSKTKDKLKKDLKKLFKF